MTQATQEKGEAMRLTEIKPGMELCVMHGIKRYEAVRVIGSEPYTSKSGNKRPGVRVQPVGNGKQYVICASKIRPFHEYETWLQQRADSVDHALELKAQCGGMDLGLVRDEIHCSVHGDVWPVLRIEATGEKADRLIKFIRQQFANGGRGNGAG